MERSQKIWTLKDFKTDGLWIWLIYGTEDSGRDLTDDWYEKFDDG